MKRLVKKAKISGKQVFDGNNHQYYQQQILGEIPISKFHDFQNLKDLIGHDSFEQIIRDLSAIKVEHFDAYNSKNNGLGLQFSFMMDNSNDKLVVISTGEKQPGRYQIFLEGIWQVE